MARALNSPIDRQLNRLLALRRDQLLTDTGGEHELGDLVHFVAVEPHDTVATVETDIGFPLFTEPAFEWVQDHGGWFEGIVILSDDGFGIALFVPDHDGIDPTMLSVMRDHANTQS
ncbi:hypothetical protein [Sphingomonas sp.]|uniref:hypothetical protein n=1 Tax=Sphingomonas sp. TaxID=28214 RepID=UPI003F6FAB1A